MENPEIAPNLPYIREFLLSLENNNYSKQTVDNYRRDLEFFGAFWDYRRVTITDYVKLLVSE